MPRPSVKAPPGVARPAKTPPASCPAALDAAIHALGTIKSVRRGHEIYAEDEPAECLYKVLVGAVRTSKLLNDGRRKIGAFYCAGDIFGLQFGKTHFFSAEATSDCTILVVDRYSVMALASRDNRIALEMWLVTAAELERARRHTMLLVKTAGERVATFLLQMANGAPSGGEIDLLMSRQDIADYLGLTIETVSRTISQFTREAAIKVPTSRHILVRNRPALQRLNG